MPPPRALSWVLVLLAWVAGPALALVLILQPDWACGDTCAIPPDWCTPFFGAVAFGPGLLATAFMIVSWRRARAALRQDGSARL